MNTLALKYSRDAGGNEKARLVHRAHDMTGTSYEGIMTIDMNVAIDLGRGGIVVDENHVDRFPGHAGLVFVAIDKPGAVALELRMNVQDEDTVRNRVIIDADVKHLVLNSVPVDMIKWIYGEPQRPIAAAA